MPGQHEEHFQSLIAQGELHKAISFLLEHTKGTGWHTSVLMQSTRFQTLKKESHSGLLSEAEKNSQQARITHALLELGGAIFSGKDPETFLQAGAADQETAPASERTPSLLAVLAGPGIVLLIIGLFVYFPCPSNAQYAVFRIALSLAVASSIFLLPAILQLEMETSLKSGGALTIFAFTYIFNPASLANAGKCAQVFDFTVFLESADGRTPLKSSGELSLRIGNDKRSEPINEDGSANFKQISTAFAGDTVPVELLAEGWQFANGKSSAMLALSGNNGWLLIERDNSRCCVAGSVRDEGGHFLPGVKVGIGDTFSETDENGRFRLEIPPGKQAADYVLSAVKAGYRLQEIRVNPADKQDVNIVLQKQK